MQSASNFTFFSDFLWSEFCAFIFQQKSEKFKFAERKIWDKDFWRIGKLNSCFRWTIQTWNEISNNFQDLEYISHITWRKFMLFLWAIDFWQSIDYAGSGVHDLYNKMEVVFFILSSFSCRLIEFQQINKKNEKEIVLLSHRWLAKVWTGATKIMCPSMLIVIHYQIGSKMNKIWHYVW